MAIVSLQRLPRTQRELNIFAFEHNIAHRRQAGPTSYLLDPIRNINRPATKWHLDHQQAHNGMAAGNPRTFGAILRDVNLSNLSQRAWWEFQNHLEHYLHP